MAIVTVKDHEWTNGDSSFGRAKYDWDRLLNGETNFIPASEVTNKHFAAAAKNTAQKRGLDLKVAKRKIGGVDGYVMQASKRHVSKSKA